MNKIAVVSRIKRNNEQIQSKIREKKNTSEKKNKHWSIESWPTFVLHQHLHMNDTYVFRFE